MTDTPSSHPKSQTRQFEILNRKGLHARAAAKFVRVVNTFTAEVWVSRDGNRVDGRAIMDLLMLAAAKGTTITVDATGPDSDKVLEALAEMINNRFDEED